MNTSFYYLTNNLKNWIPYFSLLKTKTFKRLTVLQHNIKLHPVNSCTQATNFHLDIFRLYC